MSNIVKKLVQVPQEYYQLALINIGITAALLKDLSVFYIIGSLIFVTLIASLLAYTVFKIIPAEKD
jgi:hypothetical protein